jgi:hypothetical protein
LEIVPPDLAGQQVELRELLALESRRFQSQHIGAGLDIRKPEIAFVVRYSCSSRIGSDIQSSTFTVATALPEGSFTVPKDGS